MTPAERAQLVKAVCEARADRAALEAELRARRRRERSSAELSLVRKFLPELCLDSPVDLVEQAVTAARLVLDLRQP